MQHPLSIFVIVAAFTLSSCFAVETCNDYLADLSHQHCSRTKKFVLGIPKISWYQAREECEKNGFKLASILSQEEQDNLNDFLKMNGGQDGLYWLSGKDLGDEGKFSWDSDPAVPFDNYTNWNAGEPSNRNDNEDCVHADYGAGWNDRRCYDRCQYVCQYY